MNKKLRKFSISLILISIFILMLTGVVFGDFGDTTLKKGMTHTDVATLQQKLHSLGFFFDTNYTQYFGATTEASVKSFQKSLSLKADGVAGKETLKLIQLKVKQSEIVPKDFKPISEGDKGKSVADIQTKLKALGFYTASISSEFDKATKTAVISFQKKNKLKETGIVDKDTMIKLNTSKVESLTNRANVSREELGTEVVSYSKKYLGTPYVWGASSGKGFDCSGFVMYIFKKFGVNLDHSASAQFNGGTKIARTSLKPGDLVFFTTYKKGPSHVGIYIGNNKFIHASSGVNKVTITDLSTNYYSSRYLGARRYAPFQ